jgi:hypothetical protein
MPVYELTGEQLDKAGVVIKAGYGYYLSIPPVLDGSFKPFIYRSKPSDVVVEKELTFKEAFAL